jgi:hypothetical protein
MTTSIVRSVIALGIAGALNVTPAASSEIASAHAARTTTMDETIYRPDCRNEDDYGSRSSCAIDGLGGGRP